MLYPINVAKTRCSLSNRDGLELSSVQTTEGNVRQHLYFNGGINTANGDVRQCMTNAVLIELNTISAANCGKIAIQ
jgi:hypothetical protein